jgi:hypothetical protein
LFHATASSTLRTLLAHYGPEARRILWLPHAPDTFTASLSLAEYCEDYSLDLLSTVQALHRLSERPFTRRSG